MGNTYQRVLRGALFRKRNVQNLKAFPDIGKALADLHALGAAENGNGRFRRELSLRVAHHEQVLAPLFERVQAREQTRGGPTPLHFLFGGVPLVHRNPGELEARFPSVARLQARP